MFITYLFLVYFFSLTYADCVCTPLSNDCADGYSNTCGSSSPCDSIQISTSNYELTQECIDSNNKVPYLEMYAFRFTLQDNFFKTTGGIHFKRTSYMFWYGFNNFEQIYEVTYVDTSYIVHESPINMNTGYLYFPAPVSFNMDATFTLSGDAIVEFGGKTSKGSQFLRFDTTTTTLKEESILNISTALLWDPVEFRLYNNSKLISAAVGRDNNNGKFYFYDSSTLILDEGHYKTYMPFTHYFYDNSILQIERDTKSYLEQVYLNDNSFLNISESSFIRFDSFSLSSTSSVEIGEDSVIQTPLSSLYGEITFNNKARLNSKTSTTSLTSTLSLEVIETIIGYPIISLWNENSMLNNINEIIYGGNECIDVYSFASSNNGLTLPSHYYQLANNQLIRYCPSTVDSNVHCYLNTSIWNSNFIDNNNYPIFISPHCMNSYYSNYLCHSIQNTFEVGTDSINITFADVLDTIIISEPSYNQQIINGYFNIIETTFGLKINTNQNTKSSTLKSEIIESNTFISIDTSTTINSINDKIQLDLTSLTSSPSSKYLLNATIIEIIDNSIVTLDYSTPYIQFINSNNYRFDVNFAQDIIGLYSENGFNINDGNTCYCLLFYNYYEYINFVVVLFQSNSFECFTTPLQKPCDEGYYESNNYTICSECSMINCKRCNETDCYLCSDGYYLENGNCIEKETTCEYAKSNECIKCSNGYYIENGRCYNCDDSNCISCSNSSTCSICESSLNIDGNCNSSIENGDVLSNDNIISCNSNYYLNNSECIDCNLTYSNCKECTNTQCITCQDTYELTNNFECISTHCNEIECTSCEDGYVLDQNGKCNLQIENCLIIINNDCIRCSNELYPSKQGCVDSINNCTIISTKNLCLRCSDGMYLEDMECKLCSNNCSTCINTQDTCLTCSSNKYIEDYECKTNDELNGTCSTLIATGSGCAICNDGYYRDGLSCYECMPECSTCLTNDNCLTCTDDYFMSVNGDCLFQSTIIGCAVEISTISGCTQCNDGYYNYNKICYSCNEECSTCSSSEVCLTCQNDYVLIDEKCIHYQLIDNCKESEDSKCSSCSFWHTLNSDQTGCDTQIVWWVIVLIVLFILIILIGICVFIWYVIKEISKRIQKKKQEKTTTIFDISRSNIKFNKTNNKDVVINKDEILFNDECEEIGVNEETRDLICVGNTSNHTIKVQFSVKDGCDKYEIRTNPQIIALKKGKACEFEIFIKPLCTCKINDQIMLISANLSKGKTNITPITVNTITIMTTRLDYSELIEDKKLGEGSFGIVYKGTFRGNQVAIKKMKQLHNDSKLIEEFNKEVTMLDKFRNDYIVHFYGAVFIPTKICMVTEFAQYGSLQDLIDKQKQNPPRYLVKIKILLDCSKGITYLHSNGILHRDIKPDNFLILSLDTDVPINAKLTDFGSSRNINMMMTNMTFTKGIGTPIYMAPEVLKENKYKKSADIYSFAITMYEALQWDEAYPSSKFKFPWKIADFVTSGERLPQTNTMNEPIYSLISNCWKQEPKERYTIEEITRNLENMN